LREGDDFWSKPSLVEESHATHIPPKFADDLDFRERSQGSESVVR